MRVIWIRVGKNPTVVNIPHVPSHMQELVGGPIEIVEPFPDNTALVCNESGRNEGLPLNRIISKDIDIHGDFFLCGQDEYDLCDLPKDRIDHYLKLFQLPDRR